MKGGDATRWGSTPEPLRRDDLDRRLDGTRWGPVIWYDEIDSTNRVASGHAAGGGADGLVVVADHQTAGRGRLGRVWIAPAGASLLASFVVRADVAPVRSHLLTLATALAARDAMGELTGIEVAVKWPNDLMVGDRKLAGILAEIVDPTGPVVVGIGINVNWPSPLPEEISATATSLDRFGDAPPRDDLLVSLLTSLDERIDALGVDGGAGIVSEYSACCSTLGRRVRVEGANQDLVGVATGLDSEAGLVVRQNSGSDVVVRAGDVHHLRPAP